jgi:hypothetical protein
VHCVDDEIKSAYSAVSDATWPELAPQEPPRVKRATFNRLLAEF